MEPLISARNRPRLHTITYLPSYDGRSGDAQCKESLLNIFTGDDRNTFKNSTAIFHKPHLEKRFRVPRHIAVILTPTSGWRTRGLQPTRDAGSFDGSVPLNLGANPPYLNPASSILIWLPYSFPQLSFSHRVYAIKQEIIDWNGHLLC